MRTSFPALALAAGGARGAYQAGALLALAEAGLRYQVVAGSSVGALNGAFVAQGDGSPAHLAGLCAWWRRLPGANLVRLAKPGQADVLPAFLDPGPLARLLDGALDYGRIGRAGVGLVIAVLTEVSPPLDIVSAPWRRASYFEASALSGGELRAALLAAAAIPLAFPARTVRGRRYADAGLVDPLPVQALYRRGERRIVAVLLSDRAPCDRADLPGATLLQVRPALPLDDGLLASFDFTRPTIERLIDRGHADTRAQLAEVETLADGLVELHEAGRINRALADTLPRR